MMELIDWIRILWPSLGLISIYILKKHTRPKFFENRDMGWQFYYIPIFMILGPYAFIISLITLTNKNKQTKDE